MKRRPSIGYSDSGNNNAAIGGEETDQHSGFFHIETDQILTIEKNKQTTTWNKLIIGGRLILNGQIILK